MSRRKAKNRLKNLRVTEADTIENVAKEVGVYPLLSYTFSVNLPTPQVKMDMYFLGYKLKNTNQLWNWKTLEDVKF